MAKDKFEILVTKLFIWDALKTMIAHGINLSMSTNQVDFGNEDWLGFSLSAKDKQSISNFQGT